MTFFFLIKTRVLSLTTTNQTIGKMISLEGEATTEYKSAATVHKVYYLTPKQKYNALLTTCQKEKLQELGVNNNYICRTRTQPIAFSTLKSNNQVYAYQVSRGTIVFSVIPNLLIPILPMTALFECFPLVQHANERIV